MELVNLVMLLLYFTKAVWSLFSFMKILIKNEENCDASQKVKLKIGHIVKG